MLIQLFNRFSYEVKELCIFKNKRYGEPTADTMIPLYVDTWCTIAEEGVDMRRKKFILIPYDKKEHKNRLCKVCVKKFKEQRTVDLKRIKGVQ